MTVTLYSTHCPKCAMLEKQLQRGEIEYTVCEDIDTMKRLGMMSAPGLQVDSGEVMDFAQAWAWIRENSKVK